MWQSVCGFHERWMICVRVCACAHIHFAFIHIFKMSHTHTWERGSAKCSASCVSGSIAAAVAWHRAEWQTALRCVRLEKVHEIMVYPHLGLTLNFSPSLSVPQIQFSQPPPLYMPLLYKDIPAIYRMWTKLLHTGWVSHWPPGLMKIPSISPPFLLHPITYRKAFYLTLPCLLLFVFTTLLPSSVALLLRFGWVLWSSPVL